MGRILFHNRMAMTFSRIFLSCILIIAVSNLSPVYSTSEIDNSRLFLGKYPIPRKTPDPININSKQAIKVDLKPFEIHGFALDKVKLINNGKSVELLVDQPISRSFITGGVLGTDKYIFKKKIYYWTDNTNQVAATTIDGKGYFLEDIGVFWNEKYGSYEKALQYRDGLAEIDFRIGLCPFPFTKNLLFDLYAVTLKQAQEAGSSGETILGLAIAWFDTVLPFESKYYAYPGSYTDEGTSKRYYNTIVLQMPHYPYMCLSKEQFEETFGSFKDAAGESLTKKASRFSRTMPVVEAKKIKNIILP